MRRQRWALALALIWGAWSAARSWAQVVGELPAPSAAPAARPGSDRTPEPADEPRYVRVPRDESGRPLALETAVVRFVPTAGSAGAAWPAGVEVSLIGAVHIGDRAYYEALNQEFDRYEAVLYELVAPPGTRVPAGGGDGEMHPVRMLQDGLRTMLGLESQLALIDYQKPQLVHADLSPEEFAAAMEERGESIWTLAFRMFGQNLLDQARRPEAAADEAELFTALLSGDRAAFRRALATQFEDLEGMLSVMNGPQGSALITDRNRRAVEELERQMAAGKRRLAIFYGAGHLPDLAEQLGQRGFEPRETRWFTAWDLAAGSPAESSRQGRESADPSTPERSTDPAAPSREFIFQESDV